MHQTQQMEDEIVSHRCQGGNPLGHVLFHDAPGAEAGRANITTGITAEATPKLLSPEGPFLRYGSSAKFVLGGGGSGYWRDVFPGEQGIEDQGFGVWTVEAFIHQGQALRQSFFLTIDPDYHLGTPARNLLQLFTFATKCPGDFSRIDLSRAGKAHDVEILPPHLSLFDQGDERSAIAPFDQ